MLALPMALPEPTAQGDLARTPFAHVLLYVEKHGLSGSLVIWAPEGSDRPGQDRIRFEGGRPAAARFVERAAALDRGMLGFFARASGPYAFYADTDLVGEGPEVRGGAVDPWRVIAASLRGPTRDDVVARVLAGFGDAPLRVRLGSDLARYELLPKERGFLDVIRAGPATVEELAATCELGDQAGRRLLYLLAITQSLEPYEPPSRPSIAQPVAAAPTAAPAMSSAAMPSAATPSAAMPSAAMPSAAMPSAAMSSAQSFSDLPVPDLPVPDVPVGEAPPARAASPAVSAPPPASSRSSSSRKREPSVPPPPPSGLSPEHRAFWDEVVSRTAAIDDQNYFDMLGVPTSASAETIRKAYFGLVKKWHPDRVPAELRDIKKFVDRIFGHFSRAHDTLTDETKRGNYLRSVQEGGGTPKADRELAAIVEAAMDLQKAEVLIRRRDFKGAHELVKTALETNPQDADAHAAYAWVLFNLEGSKGRLTEMLGAADHAISLHEKHDRAHYYRGVILRRMGREAQALAAFEKAAEINPKNTDAVREVRIAQMRGGASAKPGQSQPPKQATKSEGGFLSKLFGSSPSKKS